MSKALGYLSAAPRVSTRPTAEESGARAHITGVVNAFESLGWDVQKFIVGDRMTSSITESSYKIISSYSLSTLLADIARILMSFINARRAKKHLIDQVDWVYERFAALQSLGWIFKKRGIPWIIETNGLIFSEAKLDRKSIILSNLARKLEIKVYQQCDVLVCVSHTLKEIIIREANISPDKVVIIPNGVDTTFFDPGKYQQISPQSKITIGFVGTLYSWQGLGLLIKALAELRQENMIMDLHIVGDGMMLDEWIRECHRLNLLDQVTFIGRVPFNEVPTYISNFDLCFSGQTPLKSEQMYHSPLKLYEYMAMGKPVIATSFQDARRLIDQKGTGFLFEPGNLEDLISVLRHAYNSKEMLCKMGALAREEIVRNHSWEIRVKEMILQIELLLERKKELSPFLRKDKLKS